MHVHALTPIKSICSVFSGIQVQYIVRICIWTTFRANAHCIITCIIKSH